MTDAPVPLQTAAPVLADRVIDAALACVARVGVAKTTLDDVAREAGCARATVYRCFPGRLALLRAVLDREIGALTARVLDAASHTDTLGDAIATVILNCAQTFNSHPALAFVLAHEPELVAPQLSFERGSAVIANAGTVIAPAFARFVPADRAERLGEWVARITLSYLCNPIDQGHLDDPAFVRALVDDFVLPGVARTVYESTVNKPTVNEFASASTAEGVPQ
jgi:AcrR family transcriptional regulator